MFSYKKHNAEKTTLEYTATIPVEEITKRFEVSLKHVASHTEVQGFRKGSAPLDVARKQISKEKVYDELIQKLLADIYHDILEKDKVKPVLSPQVDLKKAEEGKDWEIVLKIAIEPELKIADYKKIMKEVRADLKKDDIWVPGKDATPEDTANAQAKKEKLLQKILDEIVKNTHIELSSLVVDYEISRRLTQLMDDVRKIGLTVDAYLQSKNTTQDELKKQLTEDILATYKIEYALNEIANKENIEVEESELDMLFSHIKSDKEKDEAKKNRHVYATMLRKQKVIDFLSSL